MDTNPLPRAATAFVAAALLLGSLVPDTAHARRGGLVGAMIGGAAGHGAAAATGRKTYDERTLRPEQLKACLVSANEIDAAGEALDADRASIEQRRAALRDADEALRADAGRPPAQRASREPIDARRRALQAQGKALNGDIETFNAKLAAVRPQQQAFATGCAGKRFYPSDLAGVAPSLPFDVAAYTARR